MELLNLYPQEILVRKNNNCSHESHLIIGKTYSRVYTYNYESYMKFDLSHIPDVTNEYNAKIIFELSRLPYSNYNIMEIGCLLAPFRFDSANRYTQIATTALNRNKIHQNIEIDITEALRRWKSGSTKNFGLIFKLNEGNTNSMAVLSNPILRMEKQGFQIDNKFDKEENFEYDFEEKLNSEYTNIDVEEDQSDINIDFSKISFEKEEEKIETVMDESLSTHEIKYTQGTQCVSKTKIINSYFTAEAYTQKVESGMSIIYTTNTSGCGRDITHLDGTDAFVLRGKHKYLIQAYLNGEIQGNTLCFSIEVDNVAMAHIRAHKTYEGGFVCSFGTVGVFTLNDSTLVIRNLGESDVKNLNSSISIYRLQ